LTAQRLHLVNNKGFSMKSADVKPVIEVVEEGDRRRVRTLAPQRGHYRYDDFRTDWPADLLRALADLKREWFSDSYARFEHPNYIQKHVDVTLALYNLSLSGKRILDFGCGFGASSHCFLRRGADTIVAADLVQENTDFARLFFARRGFARSVDVRHEDVVPGLKSGEYDVIWLQAVMEHLLPGERRDYLPRFWEALRPGGVLVITETPNRFWPRETHTTGGRWWLPWKSHQNVFRTLRREPKYQRYTDEDFYRSGVIGSAYSEIMDCLGRPVDCEELARGVRSYLLQVYRFARVKSPLRSAAVRSFGLAEPLLKILSGRPAMALLPFLNHLVFRKRGLGTLEAPHSRQSHRDRSGRSDGSPPQHQTAEGLELVTLGVRR
jgi:2-polyprenyl-3-methyl-5-hydroxy-6-metoxy-1,4-benzoquinol methylase